MASKNQANPGSEALPFGAGAIESGVRSASGKAATGKKKVTQRTKRASSAASPKAAPAKKGGSATEEAAAPRTRKPRKAREKAPEAKPPAPELEPRVAAPEPEPRPAPAERSEPTERAERPDRPGRNDRPERDGHGQDGPVDPSAATAPRREGDGEGGSRRRGRRRRWQDRRRKKRRPGGPGESGSGGPGAPAQAGPRPVAQAAQAGGERRERTPQGLQEVEGMLVLDKGNHGQLRDRERGYLPHKNDAHVSPRLVQSQGLRDGSIVRGKCRRGQGRAKWDLVEVESVDGRDPREVRNLTAFKQLTSIDPDFHYAVGDGSGEVSLKVIDLLCPVGRGQRGLIVAPPRSGKTVLLQQFARAIEKVYPEVHLMVLLADERPEEATEWRRTIEKGEVFVSTNDEMAKKHVELVEAVWRRARRLVELGEDVILVVDSITRIGRAYNNMQGAGGKTMSGGIDSRALERPKQFFGAARNTETAGSLTILATVLIETGSMMDKVIFEEFKGTGNMELVLSRKLADRRIFPAIDIEKTGTRKEEKLHSSRRLKLCHTLRRVLTRMHWAEAMELLVTKLDDVEKIDDFLERFEVDPEE